MSTDDSETRLLGVNLLTDVSTEKSTNLGVCVLSPDDIQNLTVRDLKEQIRSQLTACQTKFAVCTKHGWKISNSQEGKLKLSQILTEDGCVLIQIDQDKPKVGIKDNKGNVIGFVFVPYDVNLLTLRQQIIKEVVEPCGLAETFQLLEANHWPISSVQESHMIVSEIMVGSCIHTNIGNKHLHTPDFSPPLPPFKKHKGKTKELSFRSGKDLFRLTETNGSQSVSSAKQVLISYVSVESASNALKLKEELTSLEFSVYLDVHEIQSGVDWQDSLNVAVSECEVFVPLVTQKYGETLWTNREVKLADVLGKYILPVNFLDEWPPRCLAIQFATTQFIPWVAQELSPNKSSSDTNLVWKTEDVKKVAQRIADRIKGLSLNSTPSLVRRTTIVKSCPCVPEDNQLAISSDRDGKPLIMICIHPDQESFATELKDMFKEELFEVWCTTELGREPIAYLDGLASSQDGESYCKVIENSSHDNQLLQSVQTFQDKADDASVVLFVLSQSFARSRTCQQQVFYCEHRKRVIPILYEEFQMPDWMTMLMGSSRLESKRDENFRSILMQHIKVMTDPAFRLQRTLTNQNHSSRPVTQKWSAGHDDLDSSVNISPKNGEALPSKRPSLLSQETVLL